MNIFQSFDADGWKLLVCYEVHDIDSDLNLGVEELLRFDQVLGP